MLRACLLVLCLLAPLAAQPPQAEISNSAVTAKFYLPDAEKGYYRGTRFDWAGVIYSLKTKNHEYFGQWFAKYDPKQHDAIMGPVEEFTTNNAGLGYDEAKAGGTFIRIGVGVLRKPEERRFDTYKTYEIVDAGKRGVRKGKDWIEFTHDLSDSSGYAYRYTKTIRLTKNKPEMTIEHALKNTGKKPIQTTLYDHNFFVMDGQPTGPPATVKFPFDLHPLRAFQGGLAEAKASEIVFLKELQAGQSVYGEFDGFGKTAASYDIRVEHRGAGAGVKISGDIPLSKVVFWAPRTTFCAEPYIELTAEVGKTAKWKYTYQFYDVAKQP
jgi:hypothetical protein